MKLYYVTRDLQGTDNFHVLDWDANANQLVRSYDKLIAREFEIISREHAGRIRSEYGKDAIVTWTVPALWSVEYRDHVRTVTDKNGVSITRFYVP